MVPACVLLSVQVSPSTIGACKGCLIMSPLSSLHGMTRSRLFFDCGFQHLSRCPVFFSLMGGVKVNCGIIHHASESCAISPG